MGLPQDLIEGIRDRVYTDKTGEPLYVFTSVPPSYDRMGRVLFSITFMDLKTGQTKEFDYQGVSELKRVSDAGLESVFKKLMEANLEKLSESKDNRIVCT
jgi:hypothetical protein